MHTFSKHHGRVCWTENVSARLRQQKPRLCSNKNSCLICLFYFCFSYGKQWTNGSVLAVCMLIPSPFLSHSVFFNHYAGKIFWWTRGTIWVHSLPFRLIIDFFWIIPFSVCSLLQLPNGPIVPRENNPLFWRRTFSCSALPSSALPTLGVRECVGMLCRSPFISLLLSSSDRTKLFGFPQYIV